MSDYHIVHVDEKQNRARVAFHFAVPSTTVTSGKTLSDCIIQEYTHLDNDVTDVPAHSTEHATENGQLVAGTVYEYIENVEFNAHANNATKLAAIASRWSTLNGIVPDRLRDRYKFWGYNGDIST
jgi:hypothetical protein